MTSKTGKCNICNSTIIDIREIYTESKSQLKKIENIRLCYCKNCDEYALVDLNIESKKLIMEN